MNSISLSIIIPVYNGEKTIACCLESIFNQNTALQYEVILVDDGSTDRTCDIIKEQIANRPNAQMLHQKNSGAGTARNLALSHAAGGYLLFVDADDILAENSLNILKNELEKNESLDILVFMYRYFDECAQQFKKMSNRDATVYYNQKFSDSVFSFSEFPQLHECITYPWNKVFRRSFVEENGIRFSETIVHNDIFFNVACLARGQRIRIIQDILYIHTINSKEVQLTQVFDQRRLNALCVLEQCDAFLKKENLPACQLFHYTIFKVNLLDWIIARAQGGLKAHFTNVLQTILLALPLRTILRILGHRMCTPTLRGFIQQLGLPQSGVPFVDNGNLPLSIIIPVYNVEPWLPQCLQSVADQTLNPANFEVIVVDDKSTDNSLAIARDYCSRYPNFHIIELSERTPGGAGAPTNVGLNAARGEYIGLVDSDDYVKPEMFEQMLFKAMENDSDLTICDFFIYHEKEHRVEPSNDRKAWNALCKLNLSKTPFRKVQTCALNLSSVPWRKLYRREFLEECNIRYPEGDFFYEDNPLHWYAIVQARKIAVLNRALITHRIGRRGQTREDRPDKLLAFATHARTIQQFLKKTGNSREFRIDFLSWFLRQSSWIVPKLGEHRRKYLLLMKEICRGTTLADLKKYRKNSPHKLSTMYYNYLLIKGHYQLATLVRKCMNKLEQCKKRIVG